MNPESPLSRAEEIFIALLEIDRSEREAPLLLSCEGDEILVAEIRALLAAHEAMPSGFLAETSPELEATEPHYPH